ncbi:hypothetical protein ACFL3Q_11900 [Planctomycetota bacterium]
MEGRYGRGSGEDVTFYIEGTGNPYTGKSAQQVKARIEGSPKLREAAGEVKRSFSEIYETMVKSPYIETPAKLEGYVFHRWRMTPKEYAQRMQVADMVAKGTPPPPNDPFYPWYQQMKKAGISQEVMQNPLKNQRTFLTFVNGISVGAKPHSVNAYDLVPMNRNIVTRIIATNKMVDQLSKTKDPRGLNLIETPAKVMRGKKGKSAGVQMRSEHAEAGYVPVEVPAGRGRKTTYLVHPEIAEEMQVMFSRPFDNVALRAVQSVNAFQKQLNLTYSGFHHMTLSLSSMFWNPLKALPRLMATTGRFLTDKGIPALQNEENLKLLSKYGMHVGKPTEYSVPQIRRFYRSMEMMARKLPLLGKPGGLTLKAAQKMDEWQNKFLWEYLHPTMEIHSWFDLYRAGLRKGMNPDEWGPQVTKLVQKSFGGLDWESMGVGKVGRQISSLLLLAPDWTTSMLRMGFSPIAKSMKAPKGTSTPAKLTRGTMKIFDLEKTPGQNPEAVKLARKMGLKFWATGIAISAMGTDALNMLLSGHHMWENDPGHEYDTELPWRDEEGRKLYISGTKKVKEVGGWVQDPVKTLGHKLSPVTRQFMEQMTGTTPGGFDLPFKGKGTWESLPERAKHVAKGFVPFSFSGSQFGMAMPMSKGMTQYKTSKLFKKAIEARDQKEIQRIAKHARENKLDVRAAYKWAEAEITRERNKEAERKREARDR